MSSLVLHDFHERLGAAFSAAPGGTMVAHYGDVAAEHAALVNSAAMLDLSQRSRLCLTGADRQRFLNGQVTNDVKNLAPGQGCYAALVTAKGRMQSDLNIYCLPNELLLDFEPGLREAVTHRLEHYIIADDVQVLDAAPHYGLLSVQGPRAAAVVEGARFPVPTALLNFATHTDPTAGEIYVMHQPRAGAAGFDLFVPNAALAAAAEKLLAAARTVGGRAAGGDALEIARVEAGRPRFGVDMDETNLPPEVGLEARAISYAKGCYIGQEVIARLRTYGQVAKSLRGLRLAADLRPLPVKGDKLFHGAREVGYVTSAVASPACAANLALGYVRRESNAIGTELTLRSAAGDSPAQIVALPFTQTS